MELSALDHLLAYLHVVKRDRKDTGLVTGWMHDAGYTQTDINRAWLKARRFGYAKAMGLGDQLTASGLARGIEVAELLGI